MTVNNTQIEKLYKELLDSWNKQDAKGMASLFAIDGRSVGFTRCGESHSFKTHLPNFMEDLN